MTLASLSLLLSLLPPALLVGSQVLLLRLSPLLPFALSNYLYGMTKVNFFEYLAGTALGFAPGSIGFVMTGQVGRDLMGSEQGSRSVVTPSANACIFGPLLF